MGGSGRGVGLVGGKLGRQVVAREWASLEASCVAVGWWASLEANHMGGSGGPHWRQLGSWSRVPMPL